VKVLYVIQDLLLLACGKRPDRIENRSFQSHRKSHPANIMHRFGLRKRGRVGNREGQGNLRSSPEAGQRTVRLRLTHFAGEAAALRRGKRKVRAVRTASSGDTMGN
jgi:hypothetical protein